MTDHHLRELARRAQATGATEDEAAFLLARLRGGDLDHDRLTLAAYCGQRAARRAVGFSEVVPCEFGDWLRGLTPFGPRVAARSQLTVGRLLQTHCGPATEDVSRALDLLERWIDAPTIERAEAAYTAGVSAAEQVPYHSPIELRQAIWTAGGVAALPLQVERGRTNWNIEAVDTAARSLQVLSIDRLRRGCEDALSRWALRAAR